MTSRDVPLEPQKHVVTPEEQDAFLSWVYSFLNAQKTLILATCHQFVPNCNLMSFALVSRQCSLIIVTPVNSRKCRNLRQNHNVSLLALDQAALDQDLEKGIVLTLNGRAREVKGSERQDLEQIFLSRNPSLEAFARSSRSAVFFVQVYHLVAVNNFQELRELTLEG